MNGCSVFNCIHLLTFPFLSSLQFEIPEIDCEDSRRMRNFLSYLQAEKPYCATLHVIRFELAVCPQFYRPFIFIMTILFISEVLVLLFIYFCFTGKTASYVQNSLIG